MRRTPGRVSLSRMGTSARIRSRSMGFVISAPDAPAPVALSPTAAPARPAACGRAEHLPTLTAPEPPVGNHPAIGQVDVFQELNCRHLLVRLHHNTLQPTSGPF